MLRLYVIAFLLFLYAPIALLPVFADLICCDVYGVRRCSALSPDAAPFEIAI